MPSKTKITSKGQVTIPNEIRKAMNLEEGDYLIFETKSKYEANVKVIKSRPLSSLLGALKAPVSEIDMAHIREQTRHSLASRRIDEGKD